MENVEGYEITWDEAGILTLKFTDLFGEGELYSFPRREAIAIRDAMTYAIGEMGLSESEPRGPQPDVA